MSNPFASRATTIAGPGIDYAPVTPNDSADLADVAIALYIEGAGDVTFVSLKGEERTVAVSDFGWILCGVARVLDTGTTATGIHAVVIS